MLLDERGQKQTSYEIIIASTSELLNQSKGDIWSSGKIHSDQSLGIQYTGDKPLEPKGRYYWKVNVWDMNGTKLTSKEAFFELGLLKESDWKAVFITKNSSSDGKSAPMFRKDFTLAADKTVKRARLYSSALGVYTAYINGTKVGNDKLSPGWTDYTSYVMYQTYDITNLLSENGNNAIGAIVGNGWYSGHVSTGAGNVNKYGVDVALLAQVEVEYTDGSFDIIATDDTWMTTSKGPYVETDNQDGESYDARLELPGWNTPDFDEAAWSSVKIAKKSTMNTKVYPEKIKKISQIGPTVKVTQELPVVTMTQPSKGKYILDFGQNMSGIIRLKVIGEAGTKVKMRFGEMLYDERAKSLSGTLYTENLRTAKATDYYTLKGDANGEIYEPEFTYHGFRYVEITGYPGELDPNDVTALVIGSDITKTGSYNTSNEMINKLYSNIDWGQRGNFLSIPTDCPQRDERLGWTGDAQVFVRTASYNRDVNQFFKKYMLDVATAQRTSGAVYDIAPAQGHNVGEGNAAWADVAVIAPWTMYQMYGDVQNIYDNYDMMVKWVNYCDKNYGGSTSNKYIVPNCAYGDWLSMGETTPNNVVATAYFAYSSDLLSKMSRAIGKEADAVKYETLFENIRTAFNKAFVNQTTGVIKGNSQTAYLLALKMNLLPTDDLKKKAGELLVGRIKANKDHLTTGFVGVSYLCPILSDMGYSDLAYQLLLTDTFPSWLYSVKNGATTVWERWNSFTKETNNQKFGFGDVGMNSFNHYAYGSIGEWMYRYSAGIEVDQNNPGFKNIILQPTPGGSLTFVNSSVASQYGEIQSNWTFDNDTKSFNLNVKIPANSTATLYLPTSDENSILG